MEIRRGLPPPKGTGKIGIFDGQSGYARRFEFFDGAHDVQRVAVAVVCVAQQRQVARTTDAMRLRCEFGQRKNNEVRRPEHGHRGHGSGEHPELEAQILGDTCGDRIEHGPRVDALAAGKYRTETLAACLPTRHD